MERMKEIADKVVQVHYNLPKDKADCEFEIDRLTHEGQYTHKDTWAVRAVNVVSLLI